MCTHKTGENAVRMQTDPGSPHFLASLPPCFPRASAPRLTVQGLSDPTTLLAFLSPPPAATPAGTLNSFLPQDLRMCRVFPLGLYLHLVPAGLIPHRRKPGPSPPHSPCHPSTVPVPLRVPFLSPSVIYYLSARLGCKLSALFIPKSSVLPYGLNIVGAQ